jgi:hypothetical protein
MDMQLVDPRRVPACRLGSVNTTGTLTPAFPGITLTGSVRLTTEIARGGLNYRF